jgi:hypothetical protein
MPDTPDSGAHPRIAAAGSAAAQQHAVDSAVAQQHAVDFTVVAASMAAVGSTVVAGPTVAADVDNRIS